MNDGLKNIRIIFMGTPEFAVASLDALLEAGCHIIAVITSPDRPAGRGMQLSESPVKKYALAKGLKILQPEKLKNDGFIQELRELRADLQVVVAFRMLPELVWSMPAKGTINLHASLLPEYRGAAPINWAIINGEKQTGVTTFKLEQDIDTGNILLQEKIPIGDQETAGELHEVMKSVGARLLARTVEALAAGSLQEISQSSILQGSGRDAIGEPQQSLHHAPKIFSKTCIIDWSQGVNEVYNLIRGLSPYPAAFTYLNGKMLKIYRAEKEIAEVTGAPDFKTDGKTFLKFRCANGFIDSKEIQLEGKKKMPVEEFLRGWRA
jgi:methionyl-tRNA formyltransferase